MSTKLPVMSQEQNAKLLDAAARRELNMPGEDFITAWESGELRSEGASRRVTRVAMLLPLGR